MKNGQKSTFINIRASFRIVCFHFLCVLKLAHDMKYGETKRIYSGGGHRVFTTLSDGHPVFILSPLELAI